MRLREPAAPVRPHEFTPPRTDFPPPPRQVRRRCKSRRPMVVVAGVFSAIMLLMLALAAGPHALAHSFGRPVEGRIFGHFTESGRHGGGRFLLDYQYTRNGQLVNARDAVPVKTFQSYYQLGATVPVRATEFFGIPFNCIDDGPREDHMAGFAAGGLVFVFLLAVTTTLWNERARRQLLRDGAIIVGRITNKETLRSHHASARNLVRHRITWTYEPPDSPALYVKRCFLTPSQYSHVNLDQPITIFYDSHHPRRALAYELCDFKIDDGPMHRRNEAVPHPAKQD